MEFSQENVNDDNDEVNNNDRRQSRNNNSLDGLDNRVRRINFTHFVMDDHNAITIVNAYEHIDFSKLFKGQTEYYNDMDIPMDTIIAGQIMWITTPRREEKTVNHYNRQTKGSGSSPHHRMFYTHYYSNCNRKSWKHYLHHAK